MALFILLIILGIVLWIGNDRAEKIRSAYLEGYDDAENNRPKRYDESERVENAAGVTGMFGANSHEELPIEQSIANEPIYDEEILPPLAPENTVLTEEEKERIYAT